MAKEKRKTRLNKGEGGEFLGFSAFAETSTTTTTTTTPFDRSSLIAPVVAGVSTSSSSTSAVSSSSSSSSSLSPIYTGSDASLNILFSRIGQKRDVTTKSKALAELAIYFQDESSPKRAQVEALSHFLYLYQSKLSYDNTPRIRALSIQVCQQARERLPKAWNTLLLCSNDRATFVTASGGGDRGGGGGGGLNSFSNKKNGEIIGMLLCARADPAAEVRTIANVVSDMLVQGNNCCKNADMTYLQCCHVGMFAYVQRILSYNQPKDMHQDLFQKGSSTSTSSLLEQQQKEETEERFERIVGTTIEGLQIYLQDPTIISYLNDVKNSDNNTTPNDTTPESTKFLWKALSSNKASLRRKTYSLLSTVCQRLPWLVDDEKTAKQLTHCLASEKEAVNVSYVRDAVGFYCISTESRTLRFHATIRQTADQTVQAWMLWGDSGTMDADDFADCGLVAMWVRFCGE
jgi:hypothetical protein